MLINNYYSQITNKINCCPFNYSFVELTMKWGINQYLFCFSLELPRISNSQPKSISQIGWIWKFRPLSNSISSFSSKMGNLSSLWYQMFSVKILILRSLWIVLQANVWEYKTFYHNLSTKHIRYYRLYSISVTFLLVLPWKWIYQWLYLTSLLK